MSNGFCEDETLRRVLCNNIGRVCTVFTEAGGRAGDGFTGLVSDVNNDSVTLITAMPSFREIRPFGPLDNNDSGSDDSQCGCCCSRRRRRGCNGNGNGNGNGGNALGTSCTIPLDRITCVAAAEG